MRISEKSPTARRKGSQIKNLPDNVDIETNLKENTWHWDSAGQVTIPGVLLYQMYLLLPV